MVKENSENTVPMNTNQIPETAQPAAADNSNLEQTLPAAKARKTARKQSVSEPFPAAQVEPAQSSEVPEPPKKPGRRRGFIWLGILGMLVIAAIGVGIGYTQAINARQAAETNQRLIAATTQYELGLQNIKDGQLDLAKNRLEYVIQIYPTFPGAADKLAQVMVSLAQTNQNSSSTTISLEPTVQATPDTRGAQQIFSQAQQQLTAQDWQNLYASVKSLRNLDPTYEAVKVDDMYYMALRNMGIKNIQAGNLEIGIYQFAVAEQIGPIDSEANNYRTWARMYVNAGSAWGVNWANVVAGFAELYPIVPNLIDFNGVTVKDRYAQALAGYGDALQSTYNWCDAVTQYETSISIENIPSVVAKLPQAKDYCANPPATPTPTPNPEWTPTPTNSPH